MTDFLHGFHVLSVIIPLGFPLAWSSDRCFCFFVCVCVTSWLSPTLAAAGQGRFVILSFYQSICFTRGLFFPALVSVQFLDRTEGCQIHRFGVELMQSGFQFSNPSFSHSISCLFEQTYLLAVPVRLSFSKIIGHAWPSTSPRKRSSFIICNIFHYFSGFVATEAWVP